MTVDFKHEIYNVFKVIIQKVSYVFLRFILHISGVLLILSVIFPGLLHNFDWLTSMVSFRIGDFSQMTTIMFGFILIGLGRAIERKVKRVYPIILIILAISTVNSFIQGNPFIEIVFLFLVLIVCMFAHKEFYRKKFVAGHSQILSSGLVFSFLFLLYHIILFNNYFRSDVEIDLSQRTFVIGLSGSIVAFICLLLIYWYLSKGEFNKKQQMDTDKIASHINKYGGNEFSHTYYLWDKHFFWSKDDTLLFAYRVTSNKLVLLGEPIGDMQYVDEALEELMMEADIYGYKLVFYEVNKTFFPILHAKGFDFLKIGEEAFVDLDSFTLAGKKHRSLRGKINKFRRGGFECRILYPPFTDELLEELRQVSEEWLGKRKEQNFSVTYFDKDYISLAAVAVVEKDNRIIAFATVKPINQEIYGIDLMRHKRDMPNAIMDFLFVYLFEVAQTEGYQQFNMGMAPLSNLANSKFSFLSEKIANLVYEYSIGGYSFQGLRKYKSKFVSKWNEKYIAYRKKSSVVVTLLELVLLINKRPKN